MTDTRRATSFSTLYDSARARRSSPTRGTNVDARKTTFDLHDALPAAAPISGECRPAQSRPGVYELLFRAGDAEPAVQSAARDRAAAGEVAADVRDGVDSDELHLTHDFLAHMLGIHRPGRLDCRHGARSRWLDPANLIRIRDREGRWRERASATARSMRRRCSASAPRCRPSSQRNKFVRCRT